MLFSNGPDQHTHTTLYCISIHVIQCNTLEGHGATKGFSRNRHSQKVEVEGRGIYNCNIC